MQGGAELEKPAGLEQSACRHGLHSSAWGLSASLTPTLCPRGAGTRRVSLNLGLRAGDQRGRGECLGFKLGLEGKEMGRDREGEGGEQERHSGDLGAGVGVARSLGLPKVEGAWRREGVGTGWSCCRHRQQGCFHTSGLQLQVCVFLGTSSGGPLLLPLQPSLGTLYLEAASPRGPLRAELGRPEVKLG